MWLLLILNMNMSLWLPLMTSWIVNCLHYIQECCSSVGGFRVSLVPTWIHVLLYWCCVHMPCFRSTRLYCFVIAIFCLCPLACGVNGVMSELELHELMMTSHSLHMVLLRYDCVMYKCLLSSPENWSKMLYNSVLMAIGNHWRSTECDETMS